MIPLDFSSFSKKHSSPKVSRLDQTLTEKNWIQCPTCGILIYEKQLKEQWNVCPKCEHLFRLDSEDRIRLILDDGSFEEHNTDMKPVDVLHFSDQLPYSKRLKEAEEKTGLQEAIRVGKGYIDNQPLAIGVMDFRFIGGSMGMVVGEKIVRITEYALTHALPLLLISSSGGARMQEGMYSLMQMARTSAVIGRFQKEGGLYISLLTHPTTGGVSASFAFLGDIIIAEPGALIGFAGPRVIEQTTKQKLPSGFQTSEFLLEHGQIDSIVKRKHIKQWISNFLLYYSRGRKK
ncbi:MAG: acetyl-CoA carboxylase, carboxyltransferase subunit beta [Caldisericia bacterium]|nr:acetyl-CoA carboxylase, carboxyltransferase subunit beta [Caldisericia bacterium]MDD4614923.1 acetyl-CoA carboxylase, carboxyltransferase subunit beta [Caldisericia bacterium]